jgi:hypothetical protein
MEDKATQAAYLRFGVISPLLSPEPGRSLADRLAEQASKVWELPDGRKRCFSASTIEDWLYRYRNGGFPALVDPPRRDKGTFPSLSEPLIEEAVALLHEHPEVCISTIYKRLRENGLTVDGRPSRSTFYRWARQNRPDAPPPASTKPRLAFEAGWSGALWQADIMYGPQIARKRRDGRRCKTQTYLVAVIDDHSRLLCEGRFFFTQGMEAWLEVLRSACCRRGIPEKLYCDNGKVFTSPQIKRIGAVLGTQVLHAGVRDAAAKGKIERFFLTCRSNFLQSLELDGYPKSLEALNRAFRAWSETHYNRATHSAHGQTPLQRWIEGAQHLRTVDTDEADELFLFETERTVKKDGTFSLKARRYETDPSLAGKRVLLRYEPITFARVDVWFEGLFRGRATPLDLHGNDGRIRQGRTTT